MSTYACAALILLFALIVTEGARPTLNAEHNDAIAPHGMAVPPIRSLLQAQSTANCTPPRTAADAEKPFCFVPDTISTQAKQFLAQAAAGQSLIGTFNYGSTPAEQAASVATMRDIFFAATANLSKAAEAQYIHSTRNASIAGVPVMFAVPKGVKEGPPADTKVLLYIHGGGYAIGSCWQQIATPAATATAAGLTIICPEYRLAPEYPFPAGLNDVLSVYKALIDKEGYKASNVVLLGDSAGGGMVPAVAVQLQREGVALPAALGMFSPWVDMRVQGDTVRTLLAVDPIFAPVPDGQGKMPGFVGIYLNNTPSLMDDPLASPVVADYAALFPNGSLPPTLIQVGLRETILSDAVRLYHKMSQAAPAPGHVVLSPHEGMWHVFQSFFYLPEAAAASKEMAGYFTGALSGNTCK